MSMKCPSILILAAFAAAFLSPPEALAQSTSTPVEWINLVKASAADSALTKSSGCHECPDAGATS